MLIQSALISSPTGEAIRSASVHVSDIATPRSIAYRVKRALNVSAVRSLPPVRTSAGWYIALIGAGAYVQIITDDDAHANNERHDSIARRKWRFDESLRPAITASMAARMKLR